MNPDTLTYAQAERAYLEGLLSSDEWVVYRCRWRNSTVRFSTLASEHDGCGPVCRRVATLAP